MPLKLESIEIKNFKSFKGSHVIAGLDSHFTAIVGPNGSGKSNIIDSILFVLGYRAKKLRHAMLKNLITNGCDECEVSLVFNDFRITRSLRLGNAARDGTRNCTSRYELNDQEIGSAQLAEYLKMQGIDLDNNRFLILQGEIENIAQLNPHELLEYIEDCVGTTSYKASIASTENEIVQKSEELQMVSTNLKFLESDYLYKKEKTDEKIDLLKYKDKSLKMKNRVVQMKREISERKLKELANSLAEAEAILEELKGKNSETKEELKNMEKERDSLDIKRREERYLKIKKEAQKQERERKNVESRKERLEKEIARLEDEIADGKNKQDGWEREKELYSGQITENLEEIKNLKKSLFDKQQILSTSKELNIFESAKTKAEKRLVSLMEEKEKQNKTVNEISAIQNSIQEIKNANTEPLAVNSEDMQMLANETAALKKDMRETLNEIHRRKRGADEFRNVEAAYKRECEVVDAIKNVKGVYGPLKSLGTIETGYEMAVDAATKSLNSIVVETTAAAEECISIINRNRLSRTTFIILDRIENQPKDNQNDKNNGSLLYKKIKCANNFIKAFYFAFKDTLVVASLEEAKELAFGRVRRRVVTQDGKLLEKSGVMSGGKMQKKIKSSAELESIYEKMKVLLAEKESALDKARNFKDATERYNASLRRIGELQARAKSLEKGMKSELNAKLDTEISEIKKELENNNFGKLPVEILTTRGDIQIINEKICYMEKINQELKIKMCALEEIDVNCMEKELANLKNEYGKIRVPEYDGSMLEKAESEYKEVFARFKDLGEIISKRRNEIGAEYQQEAESRNKIEEVREKQKESLKILKNCEEKEQAIKTEHFLIKGILREQGLLAQEPDIKRSDSKNEDIYEMTDKELLEKSREMIEEIARKEEEYFNKKKAERHDTTQEDAALYRAIFADYVAARGSYEKIKGSHDFLSSKITELKSGLENDRTQRYNKFMDGFNMINKNIREIFSAITFGGNAELDLVDYLNPFAEGIILSIMPPKKAWKQISHLSGGEKTLSSLSLIFALHKFRPSSFYVMDEIDAALDYKNVGVIAQYLSSVDSQFIIISLRDNMFEIAESLLGVCKINEESRAIMVNVRNLAI
ncbi:structural maintenance of chromosome 4 [Enteropsectra breve]|nr:structural maintenance of chromosome 4 [Enteropsectra breve]